MGRDSTLFLTGLRGYSALAVFIIHSGGGGLRNFGNWADRLVDFGKYGVISFFVLSALTLSMSIDKSKTFNYAQFMLRRFARIFPMYAFALILFWALGGAKYYQELFAVESHSFFDLISHLTFINVWNVRYQNTIIGVEWTIPIEMWTYLIIPIIFFLFLRINIILKWLVFGAAIFISLNNCGWHQVPLGCHWAIESYLYCFIGGILAFSYWQKINLCKLKADWLVVVTLVGILFLALVRIKGAEQILTLLIMLLVLLLSRAHYLRILFENRWIVLIGNISFPFYLIHLPIIESLNEYYNLTPLMLFIAAFIITLFVAYLCHKLIEQPVLKFTGKLISYDR